MLARKENVSGFQSKRAKIRSVKATRENTSFELIRSGFSPILKDCINPHLCQIFRFSFRRLSLNTFWILIYGSLVSCVCYLRFFNVSSQVRDAVIDVIRWNNFRGSRIWETFIQRLIVWSESVLKI